MITVRRSHERGHADHGWLETYHTFSFADYFDPDFMQFGTLRVVNQDRVQAGRGFGTHGHQDMEIISYVLEGVLVHKDSMGSRFSMRPGDVQVMSAGTGVTHSEFNGSEGEDLHFMQMWVLPREQGTRPSYEQRSFGETMRGRMCALVSPDGRDGSLTIGQDALLWGSRLERDATLSHTLEPGRRGWVHVPRGSCRVNDELLAAGDGAAITGETELRFAAQDETELLLFDLP